MPKKNDNVNKNVLTLDWVITNSLLIHKFNLNKSNKLFKNKISREI